MLGLSKVKSSIINEVDNAFGKITNLLQSLKSKNIGNIKEKTKEVVTVCSISLPNFSVAQLSELIFQFAEYGINPGESFVTQWIKCMEQPYHRYSQDDLTKVLRAFGELRLHNNQIQKNFYEKILYEYMKECRANGILNIKGATSALKFINILSYIDQKNDEGVSNFFNKHANLLSIFLGKYYNLLSGLSMDGSLDEVASCHQYLVFYQSCGNQIKSLDSIPHILPEAIITLVRKNSYNYISRFEREVFAELLLHFPFPDYQIEQSKYIDKCYTNVDFAISYNQGKLLIQADGELHYYFDADMDRFIENGTTVLNTNLLERAGNKVIRISAIGWYHLNMREKHMNAIRNILTKGASIESVNYYNILGVFEPSIEVFAENKEEDLMPKYTKPPLQKTSLKTEKNRCVAYISKNQFIPLMNTAMLYVIEKNYSMLAYLVHQVLENLPTQHDRTSLLKIIDKVVVELSYNYIIYLDNDDKIKEILSSCASTIMQAGYSTAVYNLILQLYPTEQEGLDRLEYLKALFGVSVEANLNMISILPLIMGGPPNASRKIFDVLEARKPIRMKNSHLPLMNWRPDLSMHEQDHDFLKKALDNSSCWCDLSSLNMLPSYLANVFFKQHIECGITQYANVTATYGKELGQVLLVCQTAFKKFPLTSICVNYDGFDASLLLSYNYALLKLITPKDGELQTAITGIIDRIESSIKKATSANQYKGYNYVEKIKKVKNEGCEQIVSSLYKPCVGRYVYWRPEENSPQESVIHRLISSFLMTRELKYVIALKNILEDDPIVSKISKPGTLYKPLVYACNLIRAFNIEETYNVLSLLIEAEKSAFGLSNLKPQRYPQTLDTKIMYIQNIEQVPYTNPFNIVLYKFIIDPTLNLSKLVQLLLDNNPYIDPFTCDLAKELRMQGKVTEDQYELIINTKESFTEVVKKAMGNLKNAPIKKEDSFFLRFKEVYDQAAVEEKCEVKENDLCR